MLQASPCHPRLSVARAHTSSSQVVHGVVGSLTHDIRAGVQAQARRIRPPPRPRDASRAQPRAQSGAQAPLSRKPRARVRGTEKALRTQSPRIENLDLLLLRCTPLPTEAVTWATLAARAGVRVVNDPLGALVVSHKGWLAAQPRATTPETICTRSVATAEAFARDAPAGVVVKPARGSGGARVRRVPRSAHDLFESAFVSALAAGGDVIVQHYLPQAAAGEKRLLWLDGSVVGGYLRTRFRGEFRHNLKRGGLPTRTSITSADRGLVAPLSPALLAEGIRFAGIDVIGDHLIEVNAVNPGGMYHADRLDGTTLSDRILCQLARPHNAPCPERERPAL